MRRPTCEVTPQEDSCEVIGHILSCEHVNVEQKISIDCQFVLFEAKQFFDCFCGFMDMRVGVKNKNFLNINSKVCEREA